MSLKEIDQLTKNYSEAHAKLSDSMARLDADVAAVKKHHLTTIRRQIGAVVNHRNTLHAAIAQAPELFDKPRTKILHGIKVGITKGKGKLTIADQGKTVDLIRKHLPLEEDILVIVKETVAKSPLANLTAAQLKKIAVQVEDAIDSVVIKPTQGDIEKAVEALIKDGLDEMDVEGAA